MTALMSRACVRLIIVLVLVPFPARPAFARQTGPSAQVTAQNPPGFDDVLLQANDFLRQRKYEDALKAFKRANEMKRNSSAECLWGMAQAYQRLGATKNAIEACDRVVQLGGEDRRTVAFAHNLKG